MKVSSSSFENEDVEETDVEDDDDARDERDEDEKVEVRSLPTPLGLVGEGARIVVRPR